jgi:uncharacterized protein (TIGR02145 family)
MMNKQKHTWLYLLIFLGSSFLLAYSCKKDDNNDKAGKIPITTSPVIEIKKYSATSGGTISEPDSLNITGCGVCWSKEKPETNKAFNNAEGYTVDSLYGEEFTSLLTGLDAGQQYFVTAYVKYLGKFENNQDSLSIAYGKSIPFTTIQEKVLTSVVSSFDQRTINCGGTVTSEFGTEITARGICWNLTGNPTVDDSITFNGSSPGEFFSIMKNLEPNTTYYIRAYASCSSDTSYGEEISVKTLMAIMATDYEGNEYNTVEIGSQVWMIDNLKATKDINGLILPTKSVNEDWSNLSTPAYCWYNNDSIKYKDSHGALYNWYVIETFNICPDGFRYPTNDDWLILINSFGGVDKAGAKLKESGFNHWISTTINAGTNESGFTGVPGGGRNYAGRFDDIGELAYYWSSTEFTNNFSKFVYLKYDLATTGNDILDKRSGLSVRCIRK